MSEGHYYPFGVTILCKSLVQFIGVRDERRFRVRYSSIPWSSVCEASGVFSNKNLTSVFGGKLRTTKIAYNVWWWFLQLEFLK